jgi:hypothetical protein
MTIEFNRIEYNKRCAEFIGHKIDFGFKKDGVLFYGEHVSLSKLKFHSDWNWIMEVVEKIIKTKIGDGIETVEYPFLRTFGMISSETNDLMVRFNGFTLHQAPTLKDAAVQAINDFLIWYNENNQQN